MTTLGKILVFVNLVLALFIGALIVSTYIGRTDWQRAYNEVLKDRDVAKANAQAALGERDQTQAKVDQLAKDVQAARADIDKANRDAEDRVQREKAQTELAKMQINQLTANLTASKQELQASQSEKSYLRDRVAAVDKELNASNLRVQESDNARVDAEINLRRTQERNERLLAENERVNKDLRTAKNAGVNAAVATNGTARRPPAEDVEGVVKATDAQTGYITISIGSDSGLSKGDTLEVYRLRPDPAYLGIVEVIAVRADQAVAKPASRVRSVIQVGDRVSSNVVTKR